MGKGCGVIFVEYVEDWVVICINWNGEYLCLWIVVEYCWFLIGVFFFFVGFCFFVIIFD